MVTVKMDQNMNQDGIVLQPNQGKSYWVLGDLYPFKNYGLTILPPDAAID